MCLGKRKYVFFDPFGNNDTHAQKMKKFFPCFTFVLLLLHFGCCEEMRRMENNSIKRPSLFFHHLPKTGGTMLLNLFTKMARNGGYDIMHVPPGFAELQKKLKNRGYYKHYDIIGGHIPFPPEALSVKDMFNSSDFDDRYEKIESITVLRDPVTHSISNYYYIMHHGGHEAHRVIFSENATQRDLLAREFLSYASERPVSFMAGTNCVGISIEELELKNMTILEPMLNQFRKSQLRYKNSGNKCTRKDLELAKRNLQEKTRVFGINENIPAFLFLLEYHYPELFTGLYNAENVASRANVGHYETENWMEVLVYQSTPLSRELYKFARRLFEDRLLDVSRKLQKEKCA